MSAYGTLDADDLRRRKDVVHGRDNRHFLVSVAIGRHLDEHRPFAVSLAELGRIDPALLRPVRKIKPARNNESRNRVFVGTPLAHDGLLIVESQAEAFAVRRVEFEGETTLLVAQPFEVKASPSPTMGRVPDFLAIDTFEWRKRPGRPNSLRPQERTWSPLKSARVISVSDDTDPTKMAGLAEERRFFESLGIAWRRIGLPEDPFKTNLDWLAAFRHPDPRYDEHRESVLNEVGNGRTIAAFRPRSGAPTGLDRDRLDTIFHLLWTGELCADLETLPLSSNRILRVTGSETAPALDDHTADPSTAENDQGDS